MPVRLTVKQSSQAGGGQPQELNLEEPVITLGRDKSCQVVLAQQAVSRNHARISQEGNLFFLEDLNSAYGTLINGKPLPKGEKRVLRNGDTIGIATFDVRFERVPDMAAQVSSEKTSFVARNMVKDAMRGLSGGGAEERYLRVMNGPREGERIDIADAQEFVIGREAGSADIVFQDDLMSRRHIKVRRDWSGTHVEDLGSRNGIKINRKRGTQKTLKNGDEIEVGGVRFVYVSPSEPPEEPAVVLSEELARGINGKGSPSQPPGSRSKQRSAVSAPEPAPEEPKAEEPPPEEPPAEEPPAEEPPPEEPPAEEPPPEEELPAEEPPPEEEPEPEPAPEPPARRESSGGGGLLRDKSKLIPLILLGLVALGVLGVMIALLAGV